MRIIHMRSSFSSDTITNLLAAETEVTSYRFPAKLTGLTQARFSVVVSTVGSAGSTIFPKYSLNGGTTWFALDHGTGLRASISSLGVVVTGWVTLNAAAAADVLLGIFTAGGNGTADPVVRGMQIDLRSTSLGRTIPWMDPNGTDSYGNAPNTETLWPATNHRAADLTGYSTARFSFTTVTPGSAGTTLVPKYSLNSGGSWNALDGGTGLRLPWSTVGLQTSAFVTIVEAARTDVMLGLFEAGGNGIADPSARSVVLELEGVDAVTFPSTAVPDPQGRRLGCGDYDVYLQTRGGGEVIAVFPHESLSFGRRLDEFSEAEISGGIAMDDCSPALFTLEPWVHEVSLRRDGVEEWVGPLVGLTWTQDSLTLRARDLFAWLERRLLPHDRDITADLATIAAQYITDAMEGDTSPNLTAAPNPTGIIGRRKVVGATYRRAADEIRELARTGLDFTAIGRTIRFGGSELPALALVTLIEGIFEINDLTIDGLATTTQAVVLGESSEAGGAPIVGKAGGIGKAGLVQQVFDESSIRDTNSAQVAAQGHLSLLKTAPELPTGVLLDGAPVAFADLIPGARVDAALTVGGRELLGTYRLLAVDVSASASDAGVEETVTISLQPLGAVDEL